MNPGLKSSARVEAGGIPIPLFERGLFAPFSFNCAQAKASLASGNSLTAYSDLPPTTANKTKSSGFYNTGFAASAYSFLCIQSLLSEKED